MKWLRCFTDPCGSDEWGTFTYDGQTVDGQYVAATLRWAEHNRQARAQGCRICRAVPVTRVKLDDRNAGAVPVEWWYCDDCFRL